MKDEWTVPVKTGEIAKALAAAQGELQNPHMDSSNPHFKSKFASLKAVRNAVVPTFAKHGIALVQELVNVDGGVSCVVHLYHSSGESLRFGPLVMPAGKSDAHGMGSAATYSRRYSLMSVAGVVGDEDDDGNSAVESAKQTEDRAAELRLKHLDSVTYIKDALAEGRIGDASAAWFELTDEAKAALWVAPTKGGLFTTEERATMKTTEFRKAKEHAA